MNLEKFNDLIGQELNVLDLSNKLQSLGYLDICDKGNIEEIIESGSVVVDSIDSDYVNDDIEQIIVYYNVIHLAAENEKFIEASIVEITKIEEF